MQAAGNTFFFVVTYLSHVCIHACLHTYVDVNSSHNRTRVGSKIFSFCIFVMNVYMYYVCTDICCSYKYDQKVAADACPSFIMRVILVY